MNKSEFVKKLGRIADQARNDQRTVNVNARRYAETIERRALKALFMVSHGASVQDATTFFQRG